MITISSEKLYAPDGRFVAFAGSQGPWVLDAKSPRNEATLLDPG